MGVCVCVGGGGGNRWPRLTLKITSSIGNKQLSSTPNPWKMLAPFGTKNYILVRLWNTMKACQICLAQVYTGQWKFSETKRPVHVVNCFQLSDKPQSLQ